jgi:nucleoside-diphosphate-sugar epimerase
MLLQLPNRKDSMRILLTGGSGFVGSALLKRLLKGSFEVRASVRAYPSEAPSGANFILVESQSSSTNWRPALQNVDTIVHCAARVHVMREEALDPLAEYRRVNVEGTLNLARQAAHSGVRRFVFVSSIKVNGEATSLGQPFTADDAPAPSDPYGVSKQEAEQGLRDIQAETGMEVVIVRPPLVYGPGVKANFAAMMRWVARGVPLPLGAIHNVRSMVALDNLVDLLVTCLTHSAAAGQTFLVSDGEDMSTTQLLQRMGKAMNRPAHLIPVPAGLLGFAASLLGKEAVVQRLVGSLQVDIGKTRQLLHWNPPVSVDEGLRRAAEQSV